ncbi:MAG: GPR1/FUN34/YaaH family transporter [Candidatus Thermoplasmatota archaeon]|nr:GPR1/FUN34/YaaH family transporter [Candidatus Thermoplasmatota archaeon]
MFGLAVAALVIGVTYSGLADGTNTALLIPWVLFFGAIAQLIAGTVEFKRNNIFGATVFTFFSMAMFSIALTAYINSFTDVTVDTTHYAAGLVAVLVFLLIVTVASIMTNKVLFSIVVVVDLAIPILIAHYLWGYSGVTAGIFLILTSALSFYAAAAVLLNTMAGKEILPLGRPIWEP